MRRKVKRVDHARVEVLECGHELFFRISKKKAKARDCPHCKREALEILKCGGSGHRALMRLTPDYRSTYMEREASGE